MMVESLRDNRHPRAVIFVGLSLLLHSLVLILLQYSPRSFVHQDREIQFDLVPMPNTDTNDQKRRQVVETDEAEKSKEAAPDAFLGKQNQRVQRQTKSGQVGSFRNGAGRTVTPNKEQSQPSGGGEKQPSLADIGLKPKLNPLGHLNPQQRSATATSSATNDYLKNINNGSQTLLNTREYAYFSFYQRVRRQLEQYWEPGLRKRIRSMINRGRSLASEREHQTRLFVILNREGVITRVQVADTSGVLDLDEAAVDAFNRAGPFPNPPSGMIENDGTVRIEWEFILKT